MQLKSLNPEIVILPDRAALAREAAARFISLAQQAIAARGRFSVALSGGSTPRVLYVLLASPEYAQQIDWAHVHFFWGDERAVPPDHPDSNYRMANEALLSRVLVPAQNVHRILAEKNPDDAARAYEQTLREFFENPLPSPSPVSRERCRKSSRGGKLSVSEFEDARDDLRGVGVGPPRFDLILLGLGADGHTASLFPHAPARRETARWVIAYFVDKAKKNRITLTAPVINAAENILFLVAGAEKVQAVRAVLRGDYRPDDLPAQLIQPTHGRMVWLLDREAARGLEIES